MKINYQKNIVVESVLLELTPDELAVLKVVVGHISSLGNPEINSIYEKMGLELKSSLDYNCRRYNQNEFIVTNEYKSAVLKALQEKVENDISRTRP